MLLIVGLIITLILVYVYYTGSSVGFAANSDKGIFFGMCKSDEEESRSIPKPPMPKAPAESPAESDSAVSKIEQEEPRDESQEARAETTEHFQHSLRPISGPGLNLQPTWVDGKVRYHSVGLKNTMDPRRFGSNAINVPNHSNTENRGIAPAWDATFRRAAEGPYHSKTYVSSVYHDLLHDQMPTYP